MSDKVETSELREKAFTIRYTHRGEHFTGYSVSMPNYNGGEVVRLEDAEAAIEAAERRGAERERERPNAEFLDALELVSNARELRHTVKCWDQMHSPTSTDCSCAMSRLQKMYDRFTHARTEGERR